MKRILIAAALLVAPTLPVMATMETMTTELPSSTTTQVAHISGLVRTDRAPRSKKVLWLLPGKPTHYYYEYIEGGNIKTMVLPFKAYPHVPDRRPFRDAHPNGAIGLPILQIGASAMGNLLGNKL